MFVSHVYSREFLFSNCPKHGIDAIFKLWISFNKLISFTLLPHVVQHKIYLCMTMLLLICLMFYIWHKMVRLCEFVQGDLQDVRKYILLCHMCDIYFLLECVSLASCVLCVYSCYCLHWLYVNFGDLVNMEVQSRSCLDSFWCWCVHSLSLRVRLFLLTRSH